MREPLRSPQVRKYVEALSACNVKFILIGGIAATIHGSARATYDVDIVYARDSDNIRNLVEAIRPYNPYLRGAPPGLPFRWDAETIRRGLNFTLTTDLGDLDVLGEIVGGGGYEDLLPHALEEAETFGIPCLFLKLEKLVQVKRAAGRPKDLEALAELESIIEERERIMRETGEFPLPRGEEGQG